jgi:CBS domain-containing protein
MTVAAILRAKGTHVESTTPETTLYSVPWVLKIRGIGALVVTSEDRARILGIVSERDIVRGLIEHGEHLLALPVSRVMTSPVLTCAPEDRVTAVMARMTRHRVRHLPVVDAAGRLCGLVSIGDLVKHRLDELELEANILRETLIVSH